MSGQKPEVSVIMRSRNSDWVIAQALAGLFSQNFKKFELIIVDSGSKDKTLEIVKQYPHKLIEIEPGDYYPGAVLNMAIENAEADLIVFQNSDAVPLCPYTLERLVAAFDDSEVQAALTRQLPRPEAFGWVIRDYAQSFPDADETPPWITLSLPMAAMRKSAWKKHKFYTDAWASEDTEWGHWAKENGMKIKYVKNAIVMHSHNYTLKQIYGRKFVEGEADAFIFGSRDSFFKMIKRTVTSTIKDFFQYLRAGDIFGLPSVPVRRAVYSWACFKGQKLGEERIRTGDTDTSKGQVNVLNRYD